MKTWQHVKTSKAAAIHQLAACEGVIMNLKEFNRVLARKRELAVELAKEYLKALRGEENRLSEALVEYYAYVDGALFNINAPQYVFKKIPHDMGLYVVSDEDKRVMRINDSRHRRFYAEKDAIDGVANKLWTLYDNGEIRLK